MFRASSAHLQEDTVVYMQHMVLSLSMRVPGGLQPSHYADNAILLLRARQREFSKRQLMRMGAGTHERLMPGR